MQLLPRNTRFGQTMYNPQEAQADTKSRLGLERERASDQREFTRHINAQTEIITRQTHSLNARVDAFEKKLSLFNAEVSEYIARMARLENQFLVVQKQTDIWNNIVQSVPLQKPSLTDTNAKKHTSPRPRKAKGSSK